MSNAQETPISKSTPQLFILPKLGSHRVTTTERVEITQRAAETYSDISVRDLQLLRGFESFTRDYIFDTSHTARSRSVAEVPEALFAELAAEFARIG